MKHDIISGFAVGILAAVAALGVIDKLARVKSCDYTLSQQAYVDGHVDEISHRRRLDSLFD